MTRKQHTYLALPVTVKRMARMAAAHGDMTLGEYVSRLIQEDAQTTGIADLVVEHDEGANHAA